MALITLCVLAFLGVGMLWYINENLARMVNILLRIAERQAGTDGIPPKMPQHLKEP